MQNNLPNTLGAPVLTKAPVEGTADSSSKLVEKKKASGNHTERPVIEYVRRRQNRRAKKNKSLLHSESLPKEVVNTIGIETETSPILLGEKVGDIFNKDVTQESHIVPPVCVQRETLVVDVSTMPPPSNDGGEKKLSKDLLFFDGRYYVFSTVPRIVCTSIERDIFFEQYELRNFLVPEKVDLPGFPMFGRYYEPTQIYFVSDLYLYIVSKLKVLADEPRNFTALHTFALEHLVCLPKVLVEGNLAYYAFKTQGKVSPGGSPSVSYDLGISTNIYSTGMRTVVLAPNKFGYKFNGNWRVTTSKGVKMSLDDQGRVGSIVWDDDITLTDGWNNSIPGYTQYFEFTPRQRFQVYANVGRNIAGALSRYFKTVFDGEEDWQRRERQYSLLAGFPTSTLDAVCKACDAKYDSASGMVKTRFCKFRDLCDYPSGEEGVYSVGKEPGLYFTLLDSFFSGWYWYVFFLLFQCYLIYDKFGMMWNKVIMTIYVPFVAFYDYLPLVSLFVTLPHPKQMLYKTYAHRENEQVKIVNNLGNFESKLKREFGKVGKEARLYATGGSLALVDYVVAPLLKCYWRNHTFRHEVLIGGRYIVFEAWYCETQNGIASEESSFKLSPGDADALFRRIKNIPNNHIVLVYFSDDGFLVSNIDEQLTIYETDFSSCDASNGFPIFASFYFLAEKFCCGPNALRIIEQCARKTRVYNPDSRKMGKSPSYMDLQPETFFELSGNLGTTCFNNLAEIGFYSSLIECMVENDDFILTKEVVEKAAYRRGWKLTVVERTSFMSSTFLKRASGERSMLVYGAILRSFGAIDGIPTHNSFGLSSDSEFRKLSGRDRAERLIKTKAESLIHEPPSPLVEAILVRAGILTKEREYVITYADLNERYGTETYEWASLLSAVHNLRFGDIVVSPVLEKIFHTDYGTTLTPFDVSEDTEIYHTGACAGNFIM